MSEETQNQQMTDTSNYISKIESLENQLKRYEGFDIDAAKEAMKFKKDSLRKQEEEKGNYDKIIKEQSERFELEKSTLIQALTQELIGNQLGTRIASKGGDPDVLMAYLKEKEYVKINPNDKGLLNMELWWDGNKLSPDDFVEKLSSSEKFDRYFKASGNSGSGSAASANPFKNSSYSPFLQQFID